MLLFHLINLNNINNINNNIFIQHNHYLNGEEQLRQDIQIKFVHFYLKIMMKDLMNSH